MFDELIEFLTEIENIDDNQSLGQLTSSNGRMLEITPRDIKTLRLGEYLNDTVIETYLQLIANQCNGVPEVQKKVYVVNTFFFETWKKRNFLGVKNWFRKVNPFEYEHLLFPINNENHWSIVVVDLQRQLFIYYDPLEFESRVQEDTYTIQYVEATRECIERLASEKLQKTDYCQKFHCMSQNHPLQLNSFDCGVFMLQFAKFHCQDDRSHKFNQPEMDDLRLQMMGELLSGELFNEC